MKTRKSILILNIAVALLIITSCSSSKFLTLESGKRIDKRLIGKWSGSEMGKQMKGVEKRWVMDRNNDGSFVLNFENIEGIDTLFFREKGSWWIEGRRFYEFHENSKQTDIYEYEILTKNVIKFRSVTMSIEMQVTNYEFIDTRIIDDGNLVRDGSSIEKAIKVKSISEEYEFAARECVECQFMGQYLVFEKKKPYDILEFKKLDGTVVSYYFDISSFYGKW